MPKRDSTPDPAAQIAAATAELDRCLRRLHIARADRRTIINDVRGDLQTAAADGVSPAALIGPEMDVFAREAIEAGGYRPQPHDYQRVLAGGTLATIVAVVAAYFLIVVVLQPLLAAWFDLDAHYPTAGPVIVYTGIAVTSLLGVLAALKSVLAGRPAARETLSRAALLAPIGAAAGAAAAVAVARGSDDTTSAATVSLQVLSVIVPVLGALAAARWSAMHTSAGTNAAGGASQIPT